MDPSCLVTTVQAGGGDVMVWGMFSWHTLCPLVPIGHRLYATASLSIVVDHVHHPYVQVPILWLLQCHIIKAVLKAKGGQTQY